MRFLNLGMSLLLAVAPAPIAEGATTTLRLSTPEGIARYGEPVAADLESALLTARMQNRPIQVSGDAAGFRTWARPDGTITLVRPAGGTAKLSGPAGWKKFDSSGNTADFAPPLAAPRIYVSSSTRTPIVTAVTGASAGKVEFELYSGKRRIKRATEHLDGKATVTFAPGKLRIGVTYGVRARLLGEHNTSAWTDPVRFIPTATATAAPAAKAEVSALAAASVTVTSPEDGSTTARRVSLTATGTTGYTGATYQYRRGDTATWANIPAANVVNASSGAAVTWPVTVTSGVATPLTWAATDSLTADGTVSIRVAYTGTAGTIYSSSVDVLVDRNADSASGTDVGPGSVNLLTGDYSLSATDASSFGATVTRAASSRRPTLGSLQDGQAPIFGPQWASGVIVTQSQSGYTGIRQTSATSVQVMRAGGAWVDFTATAAGGWAPQPGSDDLTLTGTLTGSFILTDSDANSTTFLKSGTAWQVSTTYLPADNSTTKVVSETVSNGSRPTMIISPTSAVAAATCQTTPQTRGCRVLQFVYATATTATSSAPGDYTGQVKQILQWATSPGATAATSVAVASYAYDTSGRLVQEWDPRISPALKTAYAYDSAGRVAGLTPPGGLPWTFTYGTAGGTTTAGDGMLLTASRPTLTQGSASATDGGTSTLWMVYGVPITGGLAPYAMSASDVAAWGQTGAPTDATAVFTSDLIPGSHTGSDSTMYPTDYWYATVSYLDAVGREVNTATPGHHMSATSFDRYGNVVAQLSASNREFALSTDSGDAARLASLGLAGSTPAQRAAVFATTSVYSDDGVRLLDQYGPLHMVTLAGDLYTDGMPYLSPGAWVAARQHTAYTYDGGRPTDGSANVSGMVTQVAVGANVPGYTTDGDIRTTARRYDWATGRPTAIVTDPGGLALTQTTAYDSQGRAVKTTRPRSSGSDAGTTVTTYWSATGSGTCAGRPEWADLLCQTGPGGAITGGGSNPTTTPTKSLEYGRDGQVATITEVAGSVTRTSTTGYDAAGRMTSSTVTGGTGTAVPSRTLTYNTGNGKIASMSGGGTTSAYGYDTLGRQISYSDGAGGTTTTSYDGQDRPVKISNNIPSTTTYTYDPDVEPRGMPVSTTDSVAGTFTATYGPDGEFREGTLPGGVRLDEYRDEASQPIERAYYSSSGALLLYDWVDRTIGNQWASRATTTSTSTGQEYAYDADGRLTSTQDTQGSVCTTRTYAYDADSDRTASTTATAAAGAGCPVSGTVTPHTYDSADRLVDTGYAYDTFGRTTTSPASITDYFTNDLVHSQTTGSSRQTWTLDVLGRLGTSTVEAKSTSGTWSTTTTTTNHYAGDRDDPSWIADSATAAVTRLVAGPEGSTAAVTTATGGTALLLTDQHGDVAEQYTVGTGATTVLGYDEFGRPRTGQAATRYGWLGGFDRSAATPSGALLMGARLYDSGLGRFLQTDPVAGTDVGAYDYAGQDPLASVDLNGLKKTVWSKKWGIKYKFTVYFNRRETKDLRNFFEAMDQIANNFAWTAPVWWAKTFVESIGAFAAFLSALATLAVKHKNCVWISFTMWGTFNAWIYPHGGICK